MSTISVSWLVYHFTGSGIDVAYVGLTGVKPGIALGLIAGVVADRYDRRRLMVTADLARMGAMSVLVRALRLTGFDLLLILTVVFLFSSFSTLFSPSSNAIYPESQLRNSSRTRMGYSWPCLKLDS
jgi:MFS family permease